MRNLILSCFAGAVLAGAVHAADEQGSGVVQGDDPWLISEFRQADQTVVVGGDVLRLTPEAAASLRSQLELREKQRQGRSVDDPRFSATVSVGKDPAGWPIITSIAVH